METACRKPGTKLGRSKAQTHGSLEQCLGPDSPLMKLLSSPTPCWAQRISGRLCLHEWLARLYPITGSSLGRWGCFESPKHTHQTVFETWTHRMNLALNLKTWLSFWPITPVSSPGAHPSCPCQEWAKKPGQCLGPGTRGTLCSHKGVKLVAISVSPLPHSRSGVEAPHLQRGLPTPHGWPQALPGYGKGDSAPSLWSPGGRQTALLPSAPMA